MLDIKAYFSSVMEEDDNIIGVGKDSDGNVVVFVLDNKPRKLTDYKAVVAEAHVRGVTEEVKFIKTTPFTAPPHWGPRTKASEISAVDPTKPHRPAPAGVSTAHARVTAGTLGLVCKDLATGDTAILSNWHIFAGNGDDTKVGETLLQPGPADGGMNPEHKYATFLRCIPLRTPGPKYADAAIGKVIDPVDQNVTLEILNIGYCTGTVDAYPKEWLIKSGRTTLTTRGEVYAFADVKVDYDGFSVTHKDCIISDIYSGPGDSGSGVYDFTTRRYVGELFAGGGGWTIISQQKYIMKPLNIGIVDPPKPMFTGAVDMSHWQEPISPEDLAAGDYAETNFKANILDATPLTFTKIKDMGYTLVMLKICQPGSGIDSKFNDYYAWARTAGLDVTGYIFVDPAFSASEHKRLFDEAMVGKHFDYPPDIDTEKTSGKTPQVITETNKQISRALEAWWGAKPLVYSSISFITTNLLPWVENGVEQWGLHPLHLAWWPRSDGAYYPPMPPLFKTLGIWQVGPCEAGPYLGVGSKFFDLNTIMPDGQLLKKGTTPPPPPDKMTLTVTITGQGFVSPSGGQYDKDSTIQLQATPETGWNFINWTGDYIGLDNPLSVVMNTNKSVTANFLKQGGEPKPAEFTHYRARVISPTGLNIRRDPSTSKAPWFAVPKGTILEVIDTNQSGNDLWIRAGKDQWAAFRYQGKTYLELIMEGEIDTKKAAG